MMHIFLGLAGQAGASASNGASKGQMSPNLAGPYLVQDNTALRTVPAPCTTPHYHTSPTDHNCLACSRVGSRHALCETNAVRQRLTIKRVLTRSLGPWRTTAACVRACTLAWLLHERCMLRHRSWPCTYLYLFLNLNLVRVHDCSARATRCDRCSILHAELCCDAATWHRMAKFKIAEQQLL